MTTDGPTTPPGLTPEASFELLRAVLVGADSELSLVRYRRAPSEDSELGDLIRDLRKAQEVLARLEKEWRLRLRHI
jgi:hypothetical protein